MNAKELFKNNYNISVEHSWCAYNGRDMVKFAKSYHQHRQAEEAQGRYRKAKGWIQGILNDIPRSSAIAIVNSLKEAAFGKEEG